jgi:hypothetical protein
MQFRPLVLATLCAAFVVLPARAHHTHGNYMMAEFTHLDGSVKEVHLMNPHSWVYIEVKNAKGEVEEWALEATTPAALAKVGITRNYLKAGDTVKVRCHRHRDGSNGCLLGYLTPTHGDKSRGTGIEKLWD